MTRKSKREIDRDLERLGAPESSHDDQHVTIRNVRIGEDGETLKPVSRLDVWQDATGKWHSERTDLPAEDES